MTEQFGARYVPSAYTRILTCLGRRHDTNITTAEPHIRPQRTTFPVDDVIPASEALPLDSLGRSFALRSGRAALAMPEQARLVICSPRLGRMIHNKGSRRAEISFIHALAEAVHLAFSQHRPLALSPDDIWLTIAQGFGHHLQEHAEELRERIVRHQGRKRLKASLDASLSDPASLSLFIAEISKQIGEASDPVLHETLLCNFSTTTAETRTASEAVLMDTYQQYFEYVFMCVCGIPQVTIEGTTDDWQRIRDRIEVLATFGLEWWVSRLRPILDEFVLAVSGKPNLEFWRAIYKPQQSYGGEAATGWIGELFPYLLGPRGRVRNPLLRTPRTAWIAPVNCGISLAACGSGLSQVQVTLKDLNRSDRDVDLLAGFFGVGQSSTNNELSPIVSWAVAEVNPAN